jgi:hypothetical protein
MRWLISLFLLGLSVWAQSDSGLTRLLMAPDADRAVGARQLANAMMAMATAEHPPARVTVEKFADEFFVAIAGKKLNTMQVLAFQQALTAVMKGSVSNFQGAKQLRDTLAGIGVGLESQRVITTKFLAIGEEVRGPDDAPAKDFRK